MIGSMAGIVGLQSFWIGRSLDEIRLHIDRVESRIDRVGVRLDRIESRLDRIETSVLRDHGERIARLEDVGSRQKRLGHREPLVELSLPPGHTLSPHEFADEAGGETLRLRDGGGIGGDMMRCNWCYRPADDRAEGWTAFRRDDLKRADFKGDESERVRIFCSTCAGLHLGWLARKPAPIEQSDDANLD